MEWGDIRSSDIARISEDEITFPTVTIRNGRRAYNPRLTSNFTFLSTKEDDAYTLLTQDIEQFVLDAFKQHCSVLSERYLEFNLITPQGEIFTAHRELDIPIGTDGELERIVEIKAPLCVGHAKIRGANQLGEQLSLARLRWPSVKGTLFIVAMQGVMNGRFYEGTDAQAVLTDCIQRTLTSDKPRNNVSIDGGIIWELMQKTIDYPPSKLGEARRAFRSQELRRAKERIPADMEQLLDDFFGSSK